MTVQPRVRSPAPGPPLLPPRDRPSRSLTQLRRWARLWAAIAVAVLLLLAVTGEIPQSPDSRTFEAVTQLGSLALAAVAVLLVRRWEGLGGALLLIAGVALGVLASLQWHPVVALLVAGTFVLPGVALLFVWQETRPVHHLLALGVVVALVVAAGGVASTRVYDYYFGPAHPRSETVVPVSAEVDWVWAGAATTDGFTVSVRFDDEDAAGGLLVTGPDGEPAGTTVAPRWGPDRRTAQLAVTGLDAATTYTYTVTVDGVPDDAATGRVRTFPRGAADVVIAFSSCARVGSDGAVFDAIRGVDPDLYVIAGDLHYGDIASPEPGAFTAVLDRSLASPAQAALYRSVPVAYTWDDHDYGTNDGDRTSPARSAALAVYDTTVPHYPFALGGRVDPVAQAFTLGRVRVILTDLRSARDPADRLAPSMMGADQLAWFETELRAAAGRYPLVVWVSSVPWIAAEEAGADHWGGYPAERAEVAELIAEVGVPVLILGGDAHMLAIDDGTNATYGTTADLTVFHAGALDRPGTEKGGPYSHGAAPGAGQFGVVRVDDDGGPTLRVELRGQDWEGREILSYTYEVAAVAEGGQP